MWWCFLVVLLSWFFDWVCFLRCLFNDLPFFLFCLWFVWTVQIQVFFLDEEVVPISYFWHHDVYFLLIILRRRRSSNLLTWFLLLFIRRWVQIQLIMQKMEFVNFKQRIVLLPDLFLLLMILTFWTFRLIQNFFDFLVFIKVCIFCTQPITLVWRFFFSFFSLIIFDKNAIVFRPV